MNALRTVTFLLVLLPLPAMAALFGSLFAGSVPAGLGARDGALAPCPNSPNCVASAATDAAHKVASLTFTGPADAAFERLAKLVAAQPGAVIVTRRADYMHATFTTPLMGFVDDVEFLLLPTRNEIALRSASRLGHSDLGANRKRIEALRALWVGA